MKRTQIYLTDDQNKKITALAEDLGISRAEVIRRILDQNLLDASSQEAEQVISATAGILADHPDWQEWQTKVRGRTADQRLQDQSR